MQKITRYIFRHLIHSVFIFSIFSSSIRLNAYEFQNVEEELSCEYEELYKEFELILDNDEIEAEFFLKKWWKQLKSWFKD